VITRIELRNFMSHAHTVIEPAAGLTVLVGPNNVGKSAVVAALQILCRNENSTYVLRHGERECSVTVETDDGHSVGWRRKTSPGYVIDGQTFDRLKNSGQPEELHKALRLPAVDAGCDADFDVHFGTQKSPIFLLGSSAANAARFFASSSDAHRLMAMQKRHKEKLSDAQKEKARREAESRQLNAELATLEPLPDIDQRLEQLERAHEELLAAQAFLAAAEQQAAALEAQLAEVANCQAHSAALARLAPPPALSPVAPLEELIAGIQVAEGKRVAAAAQAEALVALTAPPALAAVEPLKQLIDDLAKVAKQHERSAAESQACAQLLPPPALADGASLARLIDQLTTSTQGLSEAQHQQAALAPLNAPPALASEADLRATIAALARANADIQRSETVVAALGAIPSGPPLPQATDNLRALIESLAEQAAHVAACETEVAAAETELIAATAALRERATGSSCAVCGSPLDPDRIVARAAAGLGGHTHA
jgi:hypothetical protein